MSDGIGGMDLRVPIGGLLVALGVVLAGYGMMTASDTALYAKSGGLNINLWWGGVMCVTGALILLFARRDVTRRKD